MLFCNKKAALLLICLILTNNALAAAHVPPPPELAATSYILMDFTTGKILAEKNAHQRLEPASITKIMTAYTIMTEIKNGTVSLSDKTVVSDKAWRMPGSRTFIEAGSSIDVDTLLKGMIIQSGNDASVALAEHTAGSEDAFVQLMNQHAHDLGMRNTHFANSTGMPNPEHLTTAYDIALMAVATIRDFPEHYGIYSVKEFTYNNIRQYNRNKLLWRDPSVDGIKTGHTDNAGYCLAASAKRDGMRLVSVAMGTDSIKARAAVSQALLNYGFQHFETHRLYQAGTTLNTSKVWMGDQEQLAMGIQQDLNLLIPRGQYQNLKAQLTLTSPLEAPISKGQQMGKVIVTLDGEAYAEIPLVALHEIAKGGLWTRIKHGILRRFE